MDKEFKIGEKTFLLDEEKAMKAYQEKQVINGRDTMTFNLLPSEVSVGIRSLPQNEGKPLGTGRCSHAKRRGAMEEPN